jgi:two-component system chemotaxis response regulator CheB
VIAVVLTGLLDDGVNALLDLRSRGGIAVVQDPRDAEYPDLPRNAIEGAGADHVVPLAEMGTLLERLVREPGPGGGSTSRGKGGRGGPEGQGGQGGGMPSRLTGPVQKWSSSAEASPEGGQPSVFSCPECHGVLAKTGPDDLPRFVCRVGHAYDPETLLSEQGDQAEKAIWTAIRSTEELLSLTRKLEFRARSLGDKAKEESLARQAAETERHAKALRALVGPERPPV